MLKLLARRRSIRKYTTEEIAANHIAAIIASGLYAASSRAIRPWEIVLVQDTKLLHKLSKVKAHGSTPLEGAKAAFVILGIPELSDVWIEDTSIVAANMLLETESLDLGACWIQIRGRVDSEGRNSEEVVRKILEIPSTRRVEAIIAVGHPDETKRRYELDDLHWEKVFTGTWGNEYNRS
jgi:nitroreductase